MTTISPYGVSLAVRPDTTPPPKYAHSVDSTTEVDYSILTGTCRVCTTPRYRHAWMLYQGDAPLDCSERTP